jgi:pyridinium-3,5-bisthiocarboxylic acid mononucleotide nickel chelatase
MRIAYFDTSSGIAGDMTLAALVDAGADRDYINKQIQSLEIDGVALDYAETHRCGFRGLLLEIKIPADQPQRSLAEIERLIDNSQLTARERDLALRIFRRLGEAEAQVHGMPLEQVHFHEVGAVDSIVDIVGVSVALCNLEIECIYASPTPTGTGYITIAHGTVSVPAPATAELLKGIPLVESHLAAELTTPTGAAILATAVDHFGPLPSMSLSRIGYGAGRKDFRQQPNLLRVLIGSMDKPPHHDHSHHDHSHHDHSHHDHSHHDHGHHDHGHHDHNHHDHN